MNNQDTTINIFDKNTPKDKRRYVIKLAILWSILMYIATILFQCLIVSNFSTKNIFSQLSWIKTPFMIYLHLMTGYLIAIYLWKRKQKLLNKN